MKHCQHCHLLRLPNELLYSIAEFACVGSVIYVNTTWRDKTIRYWRRKKYLTHLIERPDVVLTYRILVDESSQKFAESDFDYGASDEEALFEAEALQQQQQQARIQPRHMALDSLLHLSRCGYIGR